MTHSISASAHSFSLRAVSRRWTLGAALALTAAFGFAANAAHAEDLDDLKARGVLTIGTEGVYAPYTYHDESGSSAARPRSYSFLSSSLASRASALSSTPFRRP